MLCSVVSECVSDGHTPFWRTGRADCHNCCVLRSTSLPYGSGSQWHRAPSIPWVLPPRGPELCSRPWCCSHRTRNVLCQVPACWWREGLKCAPADQLLAARLHVLLRRPGDTLSRSSTNISRRRLPGPRNGLVGHRSWSSTNISQLLSTSHQSGIAFVVR